MKELGLDAPQETVDAVFASFDPDGSGSVEFDEFKRILSKGGGLTPRDLAASMAKAMARDL